MGLALQYFFYPRTTIPAAADFDKNAGAIGVNFSNEAREVDNFAVSVGYRVLKIFPRQFQGQVSGRGEEIDALNGYGG